MHLNLAHQIQNFNPLNSRERLRQEIGLLASITATSAPMLKIFLSL